MDGEVEREERKEEDDVQAALQRDWSPADIQQNPRDEDDQEEEELSFTREEKEDFQLRRAESHGEEEEEEEEQEHKMPDKVSFPIILLLCFYQ